MEIEISAEVDPPVPIDKAISVEEVEVKVDVENEVKISQEDDFKAVNIDIADAQR